MNVSRFFICAAGGLVLLAAGLLIPAYLRAVDLSVIQRAGRADPGLLAVGQTLTTQNELGTAQMLAQAARLENVSGWNQLATVVTNLSQQQPLAAAGWGNDGAVKNLFGTETEGTATPEPFARFIIRSANRSAALSHLENSTQPVVQELLRCRSLTHTDLFPPSSSAAGQAFDTAVAICGLLLDEGRLTTDLSSNIFTLAAQANHGLGSAPLEHGLLDFLSLGERFTWEQLRAFLAHVPNANTLDQLTELARRVGPQLPVLFSSVYLSGQPVAVVDYLGRFGLDMNDLGTSLRYGAGSVNALLNSGERLYDPGWEHRLLWYHPLGGVFLQAANWTFQSTGLALTIKWLCYLGSGFLLAAALHFARPAVAPLERPLQVRGFHLFREFLFSLGFLLVVLLLSEPFLAQENQRENFSFRLHLPMAGGAVPVGIASVASNVMNPTILLTLLVFFVLQALIYVSCLVKLAEIRRLNLLPRIKLRLLENEDHLFDAGLYLGFVGTIVSLIIASMGLIKFSLMAAYSSTSFGIIFVVIFKIFQLRPARRKLLLEAETVEAFVNPTTLPS